jgi:hypothetical protein
MTDTTTVDLRNKAGEFDQLFAMLLAEWWDVNSKFAVVRGLMRSDNDLKKFALRLDLDKRAFLDHAADPDADKLVQDQVHTIARLIISEKSKRRNESRSGGGVLTA